MSPEEIATTIITYEEQMRGWMAQVAQANTALKMLDSYQRLQMHIATFYEIPIVPFDAKAASIFERLRRTGVRLGTMDLKIAATVIANDATLLSRNLADFRKVPDLRVEDWSI